MQKRIFPQTPPDQIQPNVQFNRPLLFCARIHLAYKSFFSYQKLFDKFDDEELACDLIGELFSVT